MDVSNQVTAPKNVVTVTLVIYVREGIPPVYMMKITKGMEEKDRPVVMERKKSTADVNAASNCANEIV